MSEEQLKGLVRGVVVSDGMMKSCVVKVERRVKHPLLGKYIKRSSKFMVHDEENVCKIGDTISIKQTRPTSKRKSWALVEVIEKSR